MPVGHLAFFRLASPAMHGFFFAILHGLAASQHQAKAQEQDRQRQEEEIMTGYSAGDLSGDWQFKIVKGTFKTQQQIEAVTQEQAEFGWTLVEVFDQTRIRFKRPKSEASQDSYRDGNPFSTTSKASGPGCASTAMVVIGLALGWYLLVQ